MKNLLVIAAMLFTSAAQSQGFVTIFENYFIANEMYKGESQVFFDGDIISISTDDYTFADKVILTQPLRTSGKLKTWKVFTDHKPYIMVLVDGELVTLSAETGSGEHVIYTNRSIDLYVSHSPIVTQEGWLWPESLISEVKWVNPNWINK